VPHVLLFYKNVPQEAILLFNSPVVIRLIHPVARCKDEGVNGFAGHELMQNRAATAESK
jgi:hypothetical protein